MGTLRTALITTALLAGVPAHADEVERWRPLIAEASARFGVPIPWIERVISAESRGRTMLRGRPITSPAGAMGLMQLMPMTWTDMRMRLSLGSDPHDPRDNILAGTLYLRLMYDRFAYPGLFGAYNAGPRRYAEYLVGKRGLSAETRAYMKMTANPAGGAIMPRAMPIRPTNAIFFAVSEPSSRLVSSLRSTSRLQPQVISSIFVELGGTEDH